MRARQAFAELGRDDFVERLDTELMGFQAGVKVPWYREVTWLFHWETDDTNAALDSVIHGNGPTGRAELLPLAFGLSRLVTAAAATGIKLSTGKTIRWPRQTGAHWREVRSASAGTIAAALEDYRNDLHKSIGLWTITLRTGFEAEPLWDELRKPAEAVAAKAGLGDDLRSIVRAAVADDESAWEGALIRCRNILNKLSKYLYQVPGDVYPFIETPSGIRVDGDNYRNRLLAYLHQKGTSGRNLKVAKIHTDWFAAFAALVDQLGTKGKYKVKKAEVTTGVMHLYLLLAEIGARSDAAPITRLTGPVT